MNHIKIVIKKSRQKLASVKYNNIHCVCMYRGAKRVNNKWSGICVLMKVGPFLEHRIEVDG